MFKLSLTSLLVALLAAGTQAKLCLYSNNDETQRKSVIVFDQYVQDFNACRYWNWHAQNVNTFSTAQRFIRSVCWKPNIQEIGFYMESSIKTGPDNYFTNSCDYNGVWIKDLLTGSGWTCVSLQALKSDCEGRQGIDLINL
ncbi:hypothetical protein HDU96_001732 [Phlyctochytrium bullatum]|nr:hypothetical protein HDU96_001732 [Phlyctochytrium bullatum]